MSSTQVRPGWSSSSAESRRTVSGEPLPEPVEAVPLSADAIHLEASRYRYCTAFVVEGENLDRDVLERELEPLGDSLLVVGDATALKAHVHTDDPGSALRAGTALGVIERVEIANMHLQSAQREERLSQAGAGRSPDRGRRGRHRRGQPPAVREHGRDWDRRRRRDDEPVDRGAARCDRERRTRPRRSCWRTTTTSSSPARQAARLAERARPRRPVEFAPGGPRGDARVRPARGAGRTRRRWKARPRRSRRAASRLRRERSASTVCRSNAAPISASSAATPSRAGRASTPSRTSVVDRLLAEPRDVLTLITGEDEPELGPLLARVAEQHPGPRARGPPGRPAALSAPARRRVSFGSA